MLQDTHIICNTMKLPKKGALLFEVKLPYDPVGRLV